MDTLTHLSIKTGVLRTSRRSEVPGKTIRDLDPVIKAGEGPLPAAAAGMIVKIGRKKPGRAVIRLGDGQGEFIIGALVWGEDDAEETWTTLMELTREQVVLTGETLPALEMPVQMPWMATMLAPPPGLLGARTLAILVELELAVAWTILGQEGLAS